MAKEKKPKAEASASLPQPSLEANRKLAYKLIAEGYSDHDITEQTSLSKQAIWGLRGVVKKAQKKAQASRVTEQANEMTENIDPGDGEGSSDLSHNSASPRSNMKTEGPSPHNQTPNLPSATPHMEGPYNFDYDQMGKIEEFVPVKQRKLLRMYVDAFQKENREKWERNNGHAKGLSEYGRSSNPLIRKIDQRVEAMEYITLMKEAGLLPEANRGSGENDFDKFLKFFQVMQTLQGKNDKPISSQAVVDLYRTARLDEANIREKLNSAQAPTPANEFSLQVEDIKGKRELDNKKLDWEITKYSESKKDARENNAQMYGMVKEVLAGPVGEVVKTLGSAGASRIRKQSNRPEITEIECPSCHGKFKGDPTQNQIICGLCGALLSKNQPQEAPPQRQEPIIREVPKEPAKIKSKRKDAEVKAKND